MVSTVPPFSTDEIPEYYRGYVALLNGKDAVTHFRETLTDTLRFLEEIPEEKWNFAYAPGKWTLKEVLLHLMDGERIFAYRALRFSRNDTTPLAGFEENLYVPECGALSRSKSSVIREFETVRHATQSFFENLTPEMASRSGIANDKKISVRALGLVIAGHELHHMKVIRERYLG
jgi:uncharacterized damage-inducible protein DinB